MTKINEVYKCEICGNIVELLHPGADSLVCCGQPMNLIQEKSIDVGMEKHVPVVEKTANGIKVKIGSVPHPMEEKHWIEFIEVISNGKSYKQFLKPGDKPEAEFCLSSYEKVREYCNIHGLWSGV